jgi:hypothetical protein
VNDEITRDEKISFLKRLFPDKMYSLDGLARFFKVHNRTVRYWVEVYEVPTVKFTGSPMIMQESLIEFLLRVDDKNKCDERNVGLDCVIADIKKLAKSGKR